MSEYQYYEFQAIDRPLTGQQMQHLRTYSSRAQISPTSFVNEYNWGDFKGDDDAWMERYFDAFLYFANWGSRTLMFRLPARLLDPGSVHAYCQDDALLARQKNGNVILTFRSENEGGDDSYDLEGPGLLSSLIPVRAELARGDRRALYLGWLVAVQNGILDDKVVEPPVPAGLGQLSGSLAALADFLRVDQDLLHVAAQTSPALAEPSRQRDDVAAWVATLPPAEKDDILTRLIGGPENHALATELLQRALLARAALRPDPTSSSEPRRTVGDLLQAGEERTTERKQATARKAAVQAARRVREAAAARARHLDQLTGQELRLWAEIERLVVTKLAKPYDQAVVHLVDLRDLAARAGGDRGADFASRLANFRAVHARQPALLKRLARAGL